MGKKCKCPPPGAPEWMVTYGDMVTLLLCFFVLIVSFSEIKKEDQFQAVVEEIQQAFGMKGGGGKLPTDDDPTLSLIERLESIRMRQERIPNKSNVKDPGMSGRESRVTDVRQGERYVLGGRIEFQPDSVELTPETKAQLIDLVESYKLSGTENILEVSGHAAELELSNADGTRGDLDSLSYARAKAVKDFLVSDEMPAELRLDPRRFRLIGNADREPINPRAYSAEEARKNRRVEIVVSENVVRDFQATESPPAF
ncbi:MAG: flagellar motor protein MotB [Planctomycetota bacterium]